MRIRQEGKSEGGKQFPAFSVFRFPFSADWKDGGNYAIFSICKFVIYLRNVGIDAHRWRREAHRRVINEPRRHYVASGAMNNNALDALEQLRIYRVRADYRMAMRIRERHVRSALNLFTAYLDECSRILGVT